MIHQFPGICAVNPQGNGMSEVNVQSINRQTIVSGKGRHAGIQANDDFTGGSHSALLRFQPRV